MSELVSPRQVAACTDTRMKVLVSLTVLCLSLALAHGSCSIAVLRAHLNEKGERVWPAGCTDYNDKSLHPFGSQWNTANCLRCECTQYKMRCCTRYGPIGAPGCKAVFDMETCRYTFYKEDNPSELCSVQFEQF